jgi:serine/threonine protein kinase/tetratricopeptide (TPR) repeat protein
MPDGTATGPANSGSATASVGSRDAHDPGPYLEPDAEFGSRYHIERLIGEGGMGAVYLAYDRELERSVALKLLQPGRNRDPRALQRFKQELILARAVSHRNILRIHDLGDVDGVKFISMDYIEGQDLQALIRDEGRLPIPRALAFARQLCDALQAAHDAGVLHRDLKPHNVLVGAGDHLYVSDFGLAKSLEDSDAGLTRTGDVLGTPRYMSPEQVEGKPLDHRSDLYALGLILYEMVTGRVPFEGPTPTQQMIQRVRDRPKDPRDFNPELPEHWRQIILRCLEREPAARYSSAREVRADLDQGRASVAAPSRQVSFTLPVPGRRAWGMGAGLLAVVALTLMVPALRQRVWGWWKPGDDGGGRIVERKRVAVLPFQVVGQSPNLAHLGPGLSDSLSAKLFAVSSLNVASTASAERASKKDSLEKAARDLGATFLVTGTVQEGDGKLRIVANLENVASHERLWSQEFSVLKDDLLTVQDQIFSALLKKLDVGPSSDERARAAAGSTENIEAYEAYLKGRNAMRGQAELKNVESAIGFFEQALAKDSRFALAYAGLAGASLRMYMDTRETRWAERAVAAAEQGRSIAEDLLEVRLALASVYQNTGKIAQAIAELRQAVALAPSSDTAYRLLGRAYLAGNNKEEALKAFATAISINPYHWSNYNQLGYAHFTLGDYDKAAAAYLKVIELEPESFSGHNDLGWVYFVTGRYPEAIAELQKALALQPNADTYLNLGLAHAYSGKVAEAVPLLEKAVELRPQRELYVSNLGDAYSWGGQKEKATQTYRRGLELAQKDLEINPRSARFKSRLALVYAKLGQSDRARQFMDQARQLDSKDHTIMYDEAVVQALAGRIPEALDSLRKALGAGLRLSYVEADPNLASLRADSRYRDWLRTLPSASPSPTG